MTGSLPSQVYVDLDAYGHNLRLVRDAVPRGTAVAAVVKADGYGLGAVPLARQAIEAGAATLAVAHVHEGVALREAEVSAPILVMMQPPEEALSAAIQHDLTLALSDAAAARRLGELARAGMRGYRDAGAIDLPVCVIQGAADELARPEHTRRLAIRLPGSPKVLELPGGHRLLDEDAPAWAALSQRVKLFAEELLARAGEPTEGLSSPRGIRSRVDSRG